MFPTYIPVYHDIKNTYEKTNITDMGEVVFVDNERSFKMKIHCSLDEFIQYGKSNHDMGKVIVQSGSFYSVIFLEEFKQNKF